ncbi:hypothetical protein BX600DRAFT_455445, partial [Xylariales sp. PMI_506]
MCGNSSRKSFGGALAILNLSHIEQNGDSFHAHTRRAPLMAGRLIFVDCGEGSQSTTRAMFIPEERLSEIMGQSCTVGIHKTGDLTTSAIISPFIYKFPLQKTLSRSDCGSEMATMEAELSQPLELGVGGDGIIGRRVTIWAPDAIEPIAEGIIGY